MEEKIKISNAEDARRKFRIQELTFTGVLSELDNLYEGNGDLVLAPDQRLASGVKEELEKAGFGVHEFRDAIVPIRKMTVITWHETGDRPKDKLERRSTPGRDHPGLDDLWVDTAAQAREISKANISDFRSVLECIYVQARNGNMHMEVPDITGTVLEQELHDRGFGIRHFADSHGNHTQISW